MGFRFEYGRYQPMILVLLLLLFLAGTVLALWIAFISLSRRVKELELFARDMPMTVPVAPPQSDGHVSPPPKAPVVVESVPVPSGTTSMPFDIEMRRPPGTLERLDQRSAAPTVIAKPPSASSILTEPLIRPMEPEPGVGAEVTEMGRRKPAAPISEEWEAVIGGSWLNKAGVLVFVIGVALFVGYSLTELGPTGRVAVGLAAGFSMLATGVALEPRKGYAVYGRGLIGGGWAALYFTTYAAHGLAAARVITDPLLATSLLLSVAAGIILHSLHYRSQVVTGLAYFVGFATLAITEMTEFAVVASVPLAASLLVVARAFEWDEMALLGVIVTYGTYAFSVAAPPATWPGFLIGESVVAMYWLMFECFALLNLSLETSDSNRDLLSFALFAINSCGFVGVSMMQWTSAIPIYLFLAGSAALFIVDSAIRGAIARPSSAEFREMTPDRIYRPGYEASVTIGLGLASAAIFQKFSGFTVNIAMLLEGEVVLIAGLALGLRYLRFLAALILAVPVVKLLMVDQFGPRAESLAKFSLNDHSAVALVTAAVLYLDRALELAQWRSAFSYAGWFVLVLLIGFEAPVDYLGLGWLLLAGCMFELGLLIEADDFRILGYATGILGSVTILLVSLFPIADATMQGQKIALAAASAVIYFGAAQIHRQADVGENEREQARDICLGLGAAFAATLAWYILPVPLLAIGWGLLALTQIEIGMTFGLHALTRAGYVTAALAYGRLYFANFTTAGETAGFSHRLLTVVPLVAVFYYLAGRVCAKSATQREQRYVSRQFLWGASLLVVVLMRFELGRILAVVGWSAFGLVLLLVGLWRGQRELRWQSYVIALLIFMRGWATNFYVPGTLAGVPARLATAGVVIAALYAAELFSPRMPGRQPSSGGALIEEFDWIDRNAREFFSILATLLLTALLYNEVSSKALTAAWAVEGALLLVFGFALRERVLRLSALALLVGCIIKVFAYDLSNLETFARILSFIVLGLLLLGVSFIYTHHYARFKKYL